MGPDRGCVVGEGTAGYPGGIGMFEEKGAAFFGIVVVKNTALEFGSGIADRSHRAAARRLVMGEHAVDETRHAGDDIRRTTLVNRGIVGKNAVVDHGGHVLEIGDGATGTSVTAGDGDALKTQGYFVLSAVFRENDAPVPFIFGALQVEDAVDGVSALGPDQEILPTGVKVAIALTGVHAVGQLDDVAAPIQRIDGRLDRGRITGAVGVHDPDLGFSGGKWEEKKKKAGQEG